jgi:hypothetical protein
MRLILEAWVESKNSRRHREHLLPLPACATRADSEEGVGYTLKLV